MGGASGTVPGGVRPGVEVLLEGRADLPDGLLEGRRVGLITHHAAVDRQLATAADRLARAAGVRLVALFAPEHGLRGDIQAGEAVPTYTDPCTGLPVFSLYGPTKKPTPEMLRNVDVLLFDLQDAGVRFWTNLSTLALALEAAAEAGLPFVVLDRPNPLGGGGVEGNVLDLRFRSFVGWHPVAWRHGMTLGELARLINREFLPAEKGLRAELYVVPAAGWHRGMAFEETGLAWVTPSPNTPTVDTIRVYPGTCLFEGTNLSEGRGTTHPFEWIGAPWMDGYRWAERLNGLGLPGCRFRPVFFRPAFSKHKGEVCSGVQVHLTDRAAFRPVATGLHMLATARQLHPREFAWREPAGGGHPFIDLLAGTDELRLALDRGETDPEAVEGLLRRWAPALERFERARSACLLYPDPQTAQDSTGGVMA